MKDHLLHSLSPGAFEELVVKICHEILGIGVISFSSGKDGGRDAFFEGTAQRYPSEAVPWAGAFVIQAKHTEKADASCSDSDFARIVKKEAPKVAALRQAGRCDNYLLFTNRKLGALKEDELVGDLRQKTGVGNVAILGKETITSYLDGAPQIAEAMGLQVSPFVTGLPSIPPPTRDFAGRTDELEELCRMVGEHGGALIYGVRGLGGIGKTQLGLKLVELVGADYPDGHILVELGGASDHPLSSTDAMARVIRAYEPQARLPEAEVDWRRLYHQVLKDRRAILLLDDAAGAEQVEPLLPHTGCLTLVTSRQRFTLPKLHRLDLDALTPEAARELLLSLAPRLGAGAEGIAELLGGLPLALRLAGGAFAERPDLEPEEYVRRLERRGERVGLVEAAIHFNYEALTPKYQRLWRELAVFPGDFDVAGAAAVWAMEVDAAKEVLGAKLYTVSLVEWRDRRYRLHDLARDFAARQPEERQPFLARLFSRKGERYVASLRLAGHYVQVLGEANRLYEEGGCNLMEGLVLFDTEWQNIRAGQAWAAEHGDRDREAAELCISYPDAGVHCLSVRLHRDDLPLWFKAARSAAASLGDRGSENRHLSNLGLAYIESGDVEKGIGFSEQALAICYEIGDQRNQRNQRNLGIALCNLGRAYSRLGKLEKARDYHEGALAIYLGDRRAESTILGNLGSDSVRLGETKKAIAYYERQLQIAREIGDRRAEGFALTGFGIAYKSLDANKAIGYSEQGLIIAQEIGDRYGEALALGNLGNAVADLDEVEKAIGYYEQALGIARDIGDRHGESGALGGLGLAYVALGEMEKAIGYYGQALVIAQEIGDRRGECRSLANLGLAYADLGEVEKAIVHLEQALQIGKSIKDPRIVDFCSERLDQLRES